jgi:hypothetical protein
LAVQGSEQKGIAPGQSLPIDLDWLVIIILPEFLSQSCSLLQSKQMGMLRQ